MNGRAVEAAMLVDIPPFEGASRCRMQYVLVVVAGHASWEDGKCWPGVARIAALARCGESTVRRVLDHLREHKILVRVKKPTPRASAVWRLGAWYAPGEVPARAPKLGTQSAQTGHSRVPRLGTEQGSTRSEHGFASHVEPKKASAKELREGNAKLRAALNGATKRAQPGRRARGEDVAV